MALSAADKQLRERLFQAMLQATFPLKAGPDQEKVLQALIDVADQLKEHFEHELEEFRQELAE